MKGLSVPARFFLNMRRIHSNNAGIAVVKSSRSSTYLKPVQFAGSEIEVN